jgi:hypothetical protein
MKLIIILRNPIDRAFSHWNMRRANKKEQRSFRDALERQRRELTIRRFRKKGIILIGAFTLNRSGGSGTISLKRRHFF